MSGAALDKELLKARYKKEKAHLEKEKREEYVALIKSHVEDMIEKIRRHCYTGGKASQGPEIRLPRERDELAQDIVEVLKARDIEASWRIAHTYKRDCTYLSPDLGPDQCGICITPDPFWL